MAKTYRALVCCRAGMGSSLMLKIKADQVIDENHYPIKTEHGNLDSLVGFNGDLVITMSDLTDQLRGEGYNAYGITNIVDKVEIKKVLEEFLATKEEPSA
jgi:PTS system ascorbate-specific IIB component